MVSLKLVETTTVGSIIGVSAEGAESSEVVLLAAEEEEKSAEGL